MKQITLADMQQLKQKFEKYCERAEQHQLPILMMIDIKMNQTIERYQEPNIVIDQPNANAMFRVVLKAIGEDISEYLDEVE